MITQAQMFGLDNSHLSQVDNRHFLLPEVKHRFFELQKAAAMDGHDLQIVSSYRSFEQQLSIWNRKWLGQLPLNTLDGKQLNVADLSDKQKIHAIMLWSALPGASRHHWGTDFDVYDLSKVKAWSGEFALIPSEYYGEGPCAALATWLQDNADDFDFTFPYAHYCGGVAQEPWHVSYRPSATQIEQSLDINALAELLLSQELLGKTMVIKLLPELYLRYTLNQGSYLGME